MNKKYFAIAFVIAGILGTVISFTELPKVFGNYQYGNEYSGNSYPQEQSYENNQYEYDNNIDNYEYEKEYYPDKGYGPVFVAKINAENVRPNPTDSPIFGFGEFKVQEKPSNGETQLRYVISAFDVPKDDDIIAIHFHAVNDEQNQTGPHIITLCGSPANEVECPEGPGVIVAGAALERDIEDDQTFITTMAEVIEALKQGLGYVQIHTTDIPAGAARGDLVEKRNDNYRY